MTTATASLDKFRQVYADAVTTTYPVTNEAMKTRQLYWHGERIPLSEAAEAYALISQGYNEFKPNMLAKLLKAFPDGIEVTPAREASVAVYLHLLTLPRDVKLFVDKHFNADEVDVVDHFTCLQDGEVELDGEALRIWWD